MSLAECISDSDIACLLSPFDAIMQDVLTQQSFNALFACLHEHRQLAQRSFKDVLKGQHNKLQVNHRAKWQKL